ncbi:DNA polymerase III subunit delta [Methylomagnum ishizawai]|uniref:DNA polymerase III subunit delta n=1 Tax=Methylomagnum ishizawai TaxID=1760988 RepID=UPI001C3340C1|nr:DNA polymerase III subunit delta [Methylomagnum ishizawai]BBL76613.1 DNA polymerase III subunit delta [Methylomagnum ishizawai]
MKLYPEQLEEHLKRKLLPIYLLSGDEPLQLTEAADALRQAAKAQGYADRELFYADAGFDWALLREATDAFSLFGERRLLDLRIPAKPDKNASAALLRYAERPPEDAILVVSTAKLAAADQKAKWCQAIDKIGAVMQVWPLEGEKLLRWLDRRLSTRGLLADHSGLRLIAVRTEGNLLAAAQEIEKLHILHGRGKLTDEQIVQAVANSARYDVFDLAEEVLRGQAGKAYRVLMGLKAEGVAPAVALWALGRDIRLVAALLREVAGGTSQDSAYAKLKVWDNRKETLGLALRRLDRNTVHRALLLAAEADRVIKGAGVGEAWEALLAVCLCVAAPPGKAVSDRLHS